MKSTRLTAEALESRCTPTTYTVTTTNDFGTGSLRDALAKADAHPGHDNIVFKLPAPPAPHTENLISLQNGELASMGNVTISGPGAGKLIIDAHNSSRVFHINDGVVNGDSPATISGLSMIDGNAQAFAGGGIYSNESLTLKNVVISNCQAGLDGGGACVAGNGIDTAAISNCTLADNRAGGSTYTLGGGLALEKMRSFQITNVTATGNYALGLGGGIFALLQPAKPTSNSRGIIAQCWATNNSAAIGAGMCVTNDNTAPSGKVVIQNATIVNNTATAAGGGAGLEIGGGNMLVTGSTIIDNTAVDFGGGVAAVSLSLPVTIAGCTIGGNQTTSAQNGYGGGGIFFQGSNAATPVAIENCRIANNKSVSEGGGIFADNGIELTVSSSTFTGNIAPGFGGGLYTTGTGANKVDVIITGGSFVGNTAQLAGGAFEAVGDGTVTATSSKVAGNSSVGFGGVIEFINCTAAVSLQGLIVTDNVGNNGGAIDIYNTPNFRIVGGRITGNTAWVGAGIYIVNSSGSIRGVTISGNTADQGGGGVSNGGPGTVTLEVDKISGNTAPTDPDVSGTFTFV
jgi:hypothetical protein